MVDPPGLRRHAAQNFWPYAGQDAAAGPALVHTTAAAFLDRHDPREMYGQIRGV